jgi:hypothetical protein
VVFQGYRRPDGRAGTRNEIWVIATVGCVARTAQRIADAGGRGREVTDADLRTRYDRLTDAAAACRNRATPAAPFFQADERSVDRSCPHERTTTSMGS